MERDLEKRGETYSARGREKPPRRRHLLNGETQFNDVHKLRTSNTEQCGAETVSFHTFIFWSTKKIKRELLTMLQLRKTLKLDFKSVCCLCHLEKHFQASVSNSILKILILSILQRIEFGLHCKFMSHLSRLSVVHYYINYNLQHQIRRDSLYIFSKP